MRYEPVKVRNIIAVEYKKATKPWHQFAIGRRTDSIPTTFTRGSQLHVVTGREKRYWEVYSKLLGECGHKHKTEAGAKPCLRRMKATWSAIRSKQAKRTQREIKARRKVTALTHCPTCGRQRNDPHTSAMYVCPDKYHG